MDTPNNFFARIWINIRHIFSMASELDTAAAAENIKRNIRFGGANAYILVFAIFIASVGLNVNSIPVIIGAMLVSPLMGPILGIGYSLGTNDTEILRKSARNLLIMVIISLITSSLYFTISPLRLENPSELLARTNPTIFDVMIALFGGFAGAFELSKKEKGTVISGVAIATALMPPLCTVGYGIAMLEWRYAIGALYLFFINCVFIALATFISVKYLGYPVISVADPAKEKKRRNVITAVIIIIIIPSIWSAVTVVRENNFNRRAQEFISISKSLPNSYIYDYHITHTMKDATLELSLAGEPLTDAEKEMLLSNAERCGLMRSQVIIKQNGSSAREDESALLESVFARNDRQMKEKDEQITQLRAQLDSIAAKAIPSTAVAKEIAAQYPAVQTVSIARGDDVKTADFSSSEEVIVILEASPALEAEDLTKLQTWLGVRLNFENIKIVQK